MSAEQGQSWISWAESVGFKNSDNDDEDEETPKEKAEKRKENDAMKLRKEEMDLFGHCPTWDNFFLVVCEICGKVVKPQALRGHLEYRHGNSSHGPRETGETHSHHSHPQHYPKSSSALTLPSGSSRSNQISSSSSRAYSSSSSAGMLGSGGMVKSHSSPAPHMSSSLHSAPSSSMPRLPPLLKPAMLGSNRTHLPGSVSPTSNSFNASAAKSSKSEIALSNSRTKKNPSIDPVVRVERMPTNSMKKSVDSPSTSVTNSLPGEKKELPSPQQPPPLLVAMGGPPQLPGGSNASPSRSGGIPMLLHQPSSFSRSSATQVGMNAMQTVVPAEIVKKPSKSKKGSKERKLLLCKDREYDPNKHCGVSVVDSGKPCTRSLTCKTHSLSLRRAVVGRKKNFDELLSDHRAAKELLLKAAQAVKGSSGPPTLTSSNALNQSANGEEGNPPSTINARVQQGLRGSTKPSLTHLQKAVSSFKSVKPVSVRPAPSSTNSNISHNVLQRLTNASTGPSVKPTKVALSQGSNSITHSTTLTPEEPSPKFSLPDLPYLPHHPRPAAMCTFGARQIGNGLFLINRQIDTTRLALKTAFSVGKSNQLPPVKKLCLESRLPPVLESVEASNPYRFTCLDLSGAMGSISSVNPHASPSSNPGSGASNPFLASTASAKIQSGSTSPSIRSSSAKNKTVSHVIGTMVSPTRENSPCGVPPLSNLPTGPLNPPKPKTKSSLGNKVNRTKASPNPVMPNRMSMANNAAAPSSSPESYPSSKKRKLLASGSVPLANAISSTTNPVAPLCTGPTQTMTLSTLPNPVNRSLPLSFPVTIGEHMGALSRLPFVGRNSLTVSASGVLRNPTTAVSVSSVACSNSLSAVASPNAMASSPQHGLGKDLSDVLNGQLPVTTAVFHSVTVSRSMATGTSTHQSSTGMGVNIRAPGSSPVQPLLQPKPSGTPNKNKSLNSSENVIEGLGNCGSWASAKMAKVKSRKSRAQAMVSPTSSKSNHHQTISPALNLGLLLDGKLSGSNVGSAGIHLTMDSPNTGSRSPHLRTETLSPCVSSPMANGQGPTSLPPLFPLVKGHLVNSSRHPASLSPASSRTSTPSPGNVDHLPSPSSTTNITKGKSRHGSSYQKPLANLNASMAASHHHHGGVTYPLSQSPMNLTALPVVTSSGGVTSQQFSYQHVLLAQAQMNQFQSQGVNSAKNNKISASVTQPIALSPGLKLPLLAPGHPPAPLGGTGTVVQPHRHMHLKSEDQRRSSEVPHDNRST